MENIPSLKETYISAKYAFTQKSFKGADEEYIGTSKFENSDILE